MNSTAPVEQWSQELRRLWNDGAYYSELSQAAIAHSNRNEIDEKYQLDSWEAILNSAIKHS